MVPTTPRRHPRKELVDSDGQNHCLNQPLSHAKFPFILSLRCRIAAVHSGASAEARTIEHPSHRLLKTGKIRLGGSGSGAEHHLVFGRELAQKTGDDGSQASFDAIANHGVADLLSNRETDLANARPVRKGAHV